eukprot:7089516-Prymnesium_polylepis.1
MCIRDRKGSARGHGIEVKSNRVGVGWLRWHRVYCCRVARWKFTSAQVEGMGPGGCIDELASTH